MLARVALAAGLVTAIQAAPAHAEPTRLVTPPAGWRADPEQATALAQRFAATGHFGGGAAVTAAEAYVADRPGAALFVTRATASPPAAQAAQAARAALDELRATGRRAALTSGSAAERSWREHVDAGSRQVTATLAWSDPVSHAAEVARVVVASDGNRVVAVTGECLSAETAAPALATACEAALASLDPGVPAASRVALELATSGEGAAPASDPAATMGPAPLGAPAAGREPARLDQSTRVTFPPTVIPLDRPEADRRPVYVGAGVVLLALMFWWNRQRRDRFDREDSPDSGPSRGSDEDADDLHAAARGEPADHPSGPDGPSGQNGQHGRRGKDRQDP